MTEPYNYGTICCPTPPVRPLAQIPILDCQGGVFMSIHFMDQVWQHSRHKGSELLLLLAIADYANQAGTAWPSVASLACKTRLSVRRVQQLLRALADEDLPELQILRSAGPYRSNLYRILLLHHEIEREALRKLPYDQYLQTSHWQSLRQDRLTIDEFKCRLCHATKHLHVHHANYDNLGAENVQVDLITLCEGCHERHHNKHPRAPEIEEGTA